jgi:hypothetical protein
MRVISPICTRLPPHHKTRVTAKQQPAAGRAQLRTGTCPWREGEGETDALSRQEASGASAEALACGLHGRLGLRFIGNGLVNREDIWRG